MSKRFFLIPEDLYRSFNDFLNKQKSSKKLRGPAKTEYFTLDSILHDRRLNPTARKELYSQNLNAMIEAKKKQRLKPIRVQKVRDEPRTDGAIKLTSNPYGVLEDPNYVPLIVPTLQAPIQMPQTKRTKVVVKKSQPHQQQPSRSPSPQPVSTNYKSPFANINQTLENIVNLEPPKKASTSKRVKPTIGSKNEFIQMQASLIYNALQKQADIYRIGVDGRVLQPTKPVLYASSQKGDYEKIVRKLLTDTTLTQMIPGEPAITKILESTQDSRMLLDAARDRIDAYGQSGRGWFVAKKPIKKRKSTKSVIKKKTPRTKRSVQRISSKFFVKKWRI